MIAMAIAAPKASEPTATWATVNETIMGIGCGSPAATMRLKYAPMPRKTCEKVNASSSVAERRNGGFSMFHQHLNAGPHDDQGGQHRARDVRDDAGEVVADRGAEDGLDEERRGGRAWGGGRDRKKTRQECLVLR